MSAVDRSPLSRREIEIVVAWVKSGFVIASQEGEPWAQRLLAKLRGAWASAGDVAEPSSDPPPRDYQVPHHQQHPIDPPRERKRDTNAGRTESDRASFRGHGIAPGDPMPGDEQRCREHVAEICARYDASRAVMLAAHRLGLHAFADGERVYVHGPDELADRRVLLWDPDVDADAARTSGDRERTSSQDPSCNRRSSP